MVTSNFQEIGFGTHRLKNALDAISTALTFGYRLLDTAQIYGSEEELGMALLHCSYVRREDVYIASKLWFSHYDKVEEAILQSCRNIKTDYIDLYMIHKPNNLNPAEHLRAFESLEKCRQKGIIRNIGVTSFNIYQLEELVDKTCIVPDVVQVECHPFLQQKELQKKVEAMGSVFQAWYPLGSGDSKLFNDPTLKRIATKYKVTVPILILMWHRQEHHSFVVRSECIEHILYNFILPNKDLSYEDLNQIRKLDRAKSYIRVPPFVETLWYKSPLGKLL